MKAQMGSYYSVIVLLLIMVIAINGELVVNVKNQGAEVYQETIQANTNEDTIELDFQQTDGSIVTQFMDFKNEIQIVSAYILGDEELQREQIQFQILCFVTRFYKTDFVPPDAMAKLRQKNPWAVRTPEKDAGRENVTMDVLLDVRSADWISPHIKTICADAQSTYGRREELEAIVALRANSSSYLASAGNGNGALALDSIEKLNEQFMRTVKPLSPVAPSDECSYSSAPTAVPKDKPCMCHLDQCIGWYPCALKYCRAPSTSSHEAKSYRCGIHTCRRCVRYYFSVSRRFTCINS